MSCETNEHPRGSVYPLDDDTGIIGWVCINCGKYWGEINEPRES